MSDSAPTPGASPDDGHSSKSAPPPSPETQNTPPPSSSPPSPSSNSGSISPPSPSPPPPPSHSDSSPPPPPTPSSDSGSKQSPPAPPPAEAPPTPPPPAPSPPPKSSTPSPSVPTPTSPNDAPPTKSHSPPSPQPPPPPSNPDDARAHLSPPVMPPPPGSSTSTPSAPRVSEAPPPPTPKPTPDTSSSVISPVKPSPSDSGRSSSSNDTNFLPSHHSGSSSSTPKSTRGSPTPSSGNGPGVYVGVTLAGLVVVMVAVLFVVKRKRKNKMDLLATHYMPHPNLSGRSEGYYYSQANNSRGFSGSSGSYHASNSIPSGPGNGYESHRGLVYGGPSDTGGSKSWFSYEELMDITNGFSRENLIGEGGFGCVYKGWMPDGKCVAVKQLKAGSGQGEREFRAEVEIISRVHHRHLVSLVGYCIADHHRLLVYEFVPNNTLEHHLHEKGLPVLDWQKRMKIAIGSARGLAYLHEDCHPRIIHRDIKSANILLDDSYEAQVADFGLAKLSNDTNTHVSTRIMGTFGYLAPEYASSGKLTDRSDVYSFGVVLLEIITGRKPVDASQPLGDESLVEWARPLLVEALETGDCEGVADTRLQSDYAKHEMLTMIEIAAACVRHSAPKRPRMAQVVRALDNDGNMPDLSNGVKFGQSTVFNSGQYSADISKFRMMAFGGRDEYSSNYSGGCSGEQERDRAARASGDFGGDPRDNAELPHRPLNAQGASGSQRQRGSYRY